MGAKHERIHTVNQQEYAPPQWSLPPRRAVRPQLLRATSNSAQMPTPWVAGVASGLSIHLGVPVPVIRWLFVVSSIIGGAGLLLYLGLLALVPQDTPENRQHSQRGASPLQPVAENRDAAIVRNQLFILGASLLIFALLVYIALNSATISLRALTSGSVATVGLALVWSQSARLSQWKTASFWTMILSGILLFFLALTLYFSGEFPTAELLRGIRLGGGAVIGFLVLLFPLGIALARSLAKARASQARETERADIAAHLHDSVLQTLTLIRAGAENPSRVRALALTQERELRSWLYGSNHEAETSTAQALRNAVIDIEGTYGIPIDLVTVGDTPPRAHELALVAAGAEALKNAVRHGKPPVSAYLEIGPKQAELFIKDRGDGFDLDAIPHDRHGVRGSIIGRIERLGGHATIRTLANGTEIHLRIPVTDTDR